MRTKAFKYLVSTLMCIFCMICMLITSYAAQGTNGDELRVAEPQQLVIQLGPEWRSVEFMLKTDVGMYPGTIPVDDNGILRLEIGGSKTYILSCLGSNPTASSWSLRQATAEQELQSAEPEQKNTESEKTVNGIPIVHIIVFCGGIILAVSVLVFMRFADRFRNGSEDADEYDE